MTSFFFVIFNVYKFKYISLWQKLQVNLVFQILIKS